MKSVSLSYDEVKAIIQAHLNAHELKAPHRVVDIDPWAYGAPDEIQFNIALEPLSEGDVTPVTSPLVPVTAAAPIIASKNGKNGLHAPVETVHEEAPAGPGEPPAGSKRGGRRSTIGDDTRAEIYRLYERGDTAARIAEQLGLGESTVARIIAIARANNLIHQRGPAHHHRAQPAVA